MPWQTPPNWQIKYSQIGGLCSSTKSPNGPTSHEILIWFVINQFINMYFDIFNDWNNETINIPKKDFCISKYELIPVIVRHKNLVDLLLKAKKQGNCPLYYEKSACNGLLPKMREFLPKSVSFKSEIFSSWAL